MWEKLSTPEFWQALPTVVTWATAPLLLLAGFIGWKIKGWLDDREIRGLKAGENDALRERFNLAHDEQKRLTEEIDQQRANGAKLEREVAELRAELVKATARIPAVAILHLDKQLDKIASTSAVMANTVTVLSTANYELGKTLTLSGARGDYEIKGGPAKFEVTRKSE